MPTPRDDESELIFKIVTLFFEGKMASEIQATLSREYPRLTREAIYPKLAKARTLGLVRLVPPVEPFLAAQIKERFPKCRATEIQVVMTQSPQYNEAVSAVAADIALDLLRKLATTVDPKLGVGLGLGPGKATLDFARSLSAHLDDATGIPRLALFAITAGCIATRPEYAPVSFFNLFPDSRITKRVGLFAETLVPVKDFPRIQKQPGVREAFAARDEIRLVVTALGDSSDEHDLLATFLKDFGGDIASTNAIGNVQYRPFTKTGPVREKPNDLRAVTLFELDDLVSMSREKDRYVILIARQCGICGMHRANVLRPLLERSESRVFSHLVLDLATAEALLSEASAES
jgi:DNA-binding transcriptional regulator LsrR (DeoR family)